jgi:threonine dehydrogenase-like Zn-dependent dehydrogenase
MSASAFTPLGQFSAQELLITHKLPLEKWEEGFHLLENRQAAKVILIP